ncbi:TPA: TraG/TraD/VirD4 family protein, partial [Clostridioides difficile]
TSNHFVASIFVRQLYYVLAKKATFSKGGKCERRVKFLLDEFGNMPSIEGMANIITVCLGRGISFDLVVQSYTQLKSLYGDSMDTIKSNCGNKIYILTDDPSTLEEVSKTIGEKTIITNSRSGEVFSTSKSQTESLDSRRLLSPDELAKLE